MLVHSLETHTTVPLQGWYCRLLFEYFYFSHVNMDVFTCRNKTCFGPRKRVLAKVFYRGEVEVKYRASARIGGPTHDTRCDWPVSILIITRYSFLPVKTHKTSAKNPRLLTIAGAIWFCRYRQCTPSPLWMHAPVAKEERRWMTSQHPIVDRTDNLNPSWIQAVHG